MKQNYSYISILKFREVKENLPALVKSEWKNQEFRGFNAGVLVETEKYKYDLRHQCISILDLETWTNDIVGKGIIANKLLECFQLKGNNLLGDKRGVGQKTLSYYKLLLALNEKEEIAFIETIAYNLFILGQDNQNTFERFIDFFGKKYSVLGFLFFLYNNKKYLPISTSNFEHAFRVLGNESKLQKNCSWDNYINYINVIKEIKLAIETEYDESINLLDAHSYCWLIGYKNRYISWLSSKDKTPSIVYRSVPISTKGKKKNSNAEKEFEVPDLNQKESNVDWDKENRKRRLKGEAAEEHVRLYERERLTNEGRDDLAEKVKDYSKMLGQGFDVLSFNNDGSHRKIEVKASDSNSFLITSNELKMSQQDNYWIYLVSEKKGEIVIRQISSPKLNNSEKFTLIPKNYQVIFNTD